MKRECFCPALTRRDFCFICIWQRGRKRSAQGDRQEPAYKAAVRAIGQIYAADFALGDMGAKSAYILRNSETDYTRVIAKYFKDRFLDKGGEIIGESSYHSGDTNHSGHITKIRGLNPQPNGD